MTPDRPEPDPLEGALARLGATEPVPARVDQAVWRAAHARLAARPALEPATGSGRPGAARPDRSRLAWSGLAAAVAALAWLALRAGPDDRRVARGDVDADGRVDILDAWTLARAVRAGRTVATWDLSGDGAVDGIDVDALAALAVRLDR